MTAASRRREKIYRGTKKLEIEVMPLLWSYDAWNSIFYIYVAPPELKGLDFSIAILLLEFLRKGASEKRELFRKKHFPKKYLAPPEPGGFPFSATVNLF